MLFGDGSFFYIINIIGIIVMINNNSLLKSIII